MRGEKVGIFFSARCSLFPSLLLLSLLALSLSSSRMAFTMVIVARAALVYTGTPSSSKPRAQHKAGCAAVMRVLAETSNTVYG